MQTTQLSRWGNSLGIRIPKHIALQAGFDENTCIEMTLEENEIRLRRCEPQKKYTLAELVQGITPENLHDSVDFGNKQGHEIW